MSTFQQQINACPAKGVPGDRAGLNPHVYAIGNPVAEGPVNVGGFVWDGAAPGQAKSSGTGAPLGFVERVLAYYDLDRSNSAGLTVPAGSTLLVARRGDYYAVAQTASTRGQKVFAVLSNGGLKTGAAGGGISGAVETGWTVLDGGAAGDIITISNWS